MSPAGFCSFFGYCPVPLCKAIVSSQIVELEISNFLLLLNFKAQAGRGP